MRRARIKATVSVPARKKVSQETVPAESTTIINDGQDANEAKPNIQITPKVLENDLTEDGKQDVITHAPIINDTTEKCLTPIKSSPGKQSISLESCDTSPSRVSKCDSLTNITNNHACKAFSSEPIHQNQTFDDVSQEDSGKEENCPKTKSELITVAELPDSQARTVGCSPIKTSQSRSCFMRPIPRLGNNTRLRRNSIQGSGASASESEDDSRRTSNIATCRVRNDSTCSVQSAKETGANISQSNSTVKDKVVRKRRMLISESARKLAEARREFHLKHENKTPDRSKLTMYDLIYYNPASNPMKAKVKDPELARKVLIDAPEDIQEEEEENSDDPSSAMPVPQVKVGPDGQLIIDEQSLVIEQTNAKRNREALAKEAIIDDDNTGSGFYKKRQKSKEWPKWETLKFYKALNTVGTDFLLMQSLFPKRSRQEIKLKFKKEEKVNRPLVEKALAYHQEFDTDTLEKSLATFETTEREYISAQESRDNKKKARAERKRKSRIVAASIGEMDGSDDDEHEVEIRKTSQYSMTEKSANESENNGDSLSETSCKKSRVEKNTDPVGDSMDAKECQSSGSHSDSDTEIYHVRPTRSGRQPKVKKLQGPNVNTLDCGTADSDHDDDIPLTLDTKHFIPPSNNEEGVQVNHEEGNANTIQTTIPEIGAVEPGSLVILSKESPDAPGKSVLQVYMVSSNMASSQDSETNITPIDLSPELLATVTTKLSDVKSLNMKE